MRSVPVIVSSVLVVSIAVTGTSGSGSASASTTTAWRDGHFVIDQAGIVGRSDIVLDRANTQPSQAMPLGDGQLGAAVWAADGMTIQLNRADTMPYRRSPGWVVIPGLSKLTSAPDFHAVLDLYNGELTESGGGMTATVSVEAGKPEVVISVTGADPAAEQLNNPWPGQTVRVLNARDRVLFTTSAGRFPLALRSGGAYLVQQAGTPAPPFAPVTGQIATTPKTLGPVSIGLAKQQ